MTLSQSDRRNVRKFPFARQYIAADTLYLIIIGLCVYNYVVPRILYYAQSGSNLQFHEYTQYWYECLINKPSRGDIVP